LAHPCTKRRVKSRRFSNVEAEEAAGLLAGDEEIEEMEDESWTKPVTKSQSQKTKPRKRPSLKEVLTPQSNLVLLAYGMMALHSMAFDSLFPVFLHHPEQDLVDNPDVKLPFKFTGGFGLGMIESSLQKESNLYGAD
jgi:hypothetical protein